MPHETDHFALGAGALQRGQFDQAVIHFNEALAVRPDVAEGYYGRGSARLAKANLGEAINDYKQAIRLRLHYPEAFSGLANALINAGELEQANCVCRDGLALWPNSLVLKRLRVRAYREAGQLDDAIAFCREALVQQPDSQLHGDLLFTLHFHPAYGRAQLREEHERWHAIHAAPLKRFVVPHQNDRSEHRRFRIGYVAHDLGNNALGRFFLPLLVNHDRRGFEIFCYCNLVRQNAMGQRLQSAADVWRSAISMNNEQLDGVIRQDQIDILVDLSMHTEGNRLLTFARKPAPVQVTYLAYCSTTGLETIDYRLTDPYLETPTAGSDGKVYVEAPAVLPQSYWCYSVPAEAPAAGPLPARSQGFVTFGCLNDFAKVTPAVLSLWCRILRNVPDSKLLLHCKLGTHRQRAIEHLRRESIDPGRLQFMGFQPLNRYYEHYNHVDIGLDPFPWCGGTTTCDALWMGVPVVSLAGETGVSRGGLSILSNIGLADLVARDPDQYVQIASQLARDLPRLAALRQTLRDRMRSSALMNPTRFARGVEDLFRAMWTRWCQSS